jgi:endonuclease YncB( thermonuclease family)
MLFLNSTGREPPRRFGLLRIRIKGVDMLNLFTCKTFLLAVFIVVAGVSPVIPAPTWQARVVAVADGDTVTVEPAEGGDRVKIRLWGVDAPESKQPFGQTAKGYVTKLLLFKPVTVNEIDRDRYRRTVAVLELADGTVLQEDLLKGGFVWVYQQYCRTCAAWKRLEAQARKEKKGLWADDEPVAPWKWRKHKR